MYFFVPTAMVTTSTSYKINDIERVSVFAGRMGREVRETWKATVDGRQVTVIVSPYHTNVAHTPFPFKAGDTVLISGSERNGVLKIRIAQATKK